MWWGSWHKLLTCRGAELWSLRSVEETCRQLVLVSFDLLLSDHFDLVLDKNILLLSSPLLLNSMNERLGLPHRLLNVLNFHLHGPLLHRQLLSKCADLRLLTLGHVHRVSDLLSFFLEELDMRWEFFLFFNIILDPFPHARTLLLLVTLLALFTRRWKNKVLGIASALGLDFLEWLEVNWDIYSLLDRSECLLHLLRRHQHIFCVLDFEIKHKLVFVAI